MNFPKKGDIRISRRFHFLPIVVGDVKVVFDFLYYFERYVVDEAYHRERWWSTEIIMAPSEYKKFVKNIGLQLTSKDEKYRKYAKLIIEKEK